VLVQPVVLHLLWTGQLPADLRKINRLGVEHRERHRSGLYAALKARFTDERCADLGVDGAVGYYFGVQSSPS
jgi:hypothetical protein